MDDTQSIPSINVLQYRFPNRFPTVPEVNSPPKKAKKKKHKAPENLEILSSDPEDLNKRYKAIYDDVRIEHNWYVD